MQCIDIDNARGNANAINCFAQFPNVNFTLNLFQNMFQFDCKF